MTRREKYEEILELEQEIDEFLLALYEAKDKSEYELYRQMILINIGLIKSILGHEKE